MASIQQSLNQMLMSAQLGAGLYAHTPAAKSKAEWKNLEKRDEAVQKQLDIVEPKVGVEPSEADPVYTKAFKEQTDIARQKYELKPTEESYKEYTDLKQSFEEWESALQESQQKRADALTSQKEQFKLRRQLLEGTPEVPVKKTKIMEV